MFNKDDNPYHKLTAEQKRELASKAGKASAEARRRRADLKRATQSILSGPISEPALRQMLKLYGIDDASNADGIALVMVQKALTGDKDAAVYVRDTSGQSPTVKQELTLDRPAEGADLRLMATADLQRMIDDD